jgi:hypothetical protein
MTKVKLKNKLNDDYIKGQILEQKKKYLKKLRLNKKVKTK